VLIAVPVLCAIDTAARYGMRKQLHRQRGRGGCMHRVTAAGHSGAVADLIAQLRQDHHHGLEVVGACLADSHGRTEVGGVPVTGGLGDVAWAAGETCSDTVAVLACPEMDGVALRRLAWELEKEGTDLCVAPALMDVAGPRTTIRPVAGLPLLHVDHAEITGVKWAVKSVFDKAAATALLGVFGPLLIFIAIAIAVRDGWPVLFNQTRIGKDGIGISRGQAQRILMARALYKDPSYVFFDEATSALDAETESLIVNKLHNVLKGKTVVVIAHRMSTIKRADQIVLLDQGEVIEMGTHQQLVASQGSYFDLVRNQLDLAE